jgi:hypothetical protein
MNRWLDPGDAVAERAEARFPSLDSLVQRRIAFAAVRNVFPRIGIQRAKHVLGRQSVNVIIVSH